MEGNTTVEEARRILGNNFIGREELLMHNDKIGIEVPVDVPPLPYSKDFLAANAKDYLLILGVSVMKDGSRLSLSALRNFFGTDPHLAEPCFYNQDWYLNEDFLHHAMENKWYLIRHSVYESSRANSPEDLANKYNFPTALQCAYAFFTSWHCRSECLWQHDFIWCSDHDHNNDRIYVGRYYDTDGINKNGFSIHRHLALRNCYGGISVL